MKDMSAKDLIEELKEALQREDELSLDMELESLDEWDSLAILSVITLFDELFDKTVEQDAILDCVTVKDLIKIVAPELV